MKFVAPRLLVAAAAFLATTSLLSAQLALPRTSPAASISQTIGTTDITIAYHRPAVRGRTIWGELVPWGEVWRAGANEATTITFADAVTVEGRKVPAGTYAVYAVPGAERFTLILNRGHDNWGAFGYDAEEDVLRVDVSPRRVPFTEWLTYDITPTGEQGAEIALAWERLEVSFFVEVDVEDIVRRQIETAVAAAPDDDWQTFLTAATYFRDNALDAEKARAWADRALAAHEHFWTLELSAKIAHDDGDTERAIKLLTRALELARDGAPESYVRELEKMLERFEK